MSIKKSKKTGKTDKKERLKGNTFINAVVSVFINNPFNGFNFRQVAKFLGAQDKASKELIKNILFELEEDEQIIQISRGKYQRHPNLVTDHISKTTITGIVDMKQTGKAYIITEELGEDVYIASNNTYHALHGDKVRVRLFPKRKDRKLEGQIIEVISRSKVHIVGIIQATSKFAFVIPDNVSVPVDLYIPLEKLHGARNGEKVIARITEWPEQSNNPFGEIIEILGQPGNNDVEMNAILAEYNFPLRFPNPVIKEAENFSESIPDEEIKKRKDFRNVITITIDPEDAKDFDDALSLRRIDNDTWEVGIHIADVSWYVRKDSVLDEEAFLRGTSVYLVDRTIPMLPEKLSNNICSLQPGKDKLCFSAVFIMDDDANILNEWFGKTVINSNCRFNYNEVQKIIEGDNGDFKEEIMILHDLASKLREERFKKGSINFKTTEVKFRLDENGKPLETYIKEQKESNFLIEDFMLLANKKVAEKIGKIKGKSVPKTFVYRIHDKPSPEKLNDFVELVRKLGYSMNTGSRKGLATSFNNLFRQIEGKGEENMIETIAIRTMAKAIYSTQNIGHYGLGFDYYSHFTSPIRRYPDLMTHRLLYAYLNGQPSVDATVLEEKCDHSSDMEKKAVEAERASVKYKQAEYLSDKIGQEFNGLISGISKWGIFVELEGSKCEGRVAMKDMLDDFYYLDDENYRVIGRKYRKEYKLGDPVRVIVKEINLSRKQMDFELVEKD
ncbi:MAG: ribonuclease R [Bacteroidetes bacterium]|nr:ribonuclease R [Bacteroidota bacterium]